MVKKGEVNIKGKTYQTVALRVSDFWADFNGWSITTEILDRNEKTVVMKAVIADMDGRVRAVGHSEESRTSSQINKTSALENAETSAIGRALACLGLSGSGEFASANEVANAIHQQNVQKAKPPVPPYKSAIEVKDKVITTAQAAEIERLLTECQVRGVEVDEEKFLKFYNAPSIKTIGAKHLDFIKEGLAKRLAPAEVTE